MTPRNLSVAIGLVAVVGAASLLSSAPSHGGLPGNGLTTAQLANRDEALSAFREGRFPAAYGRFMALADAGHAPSAEISLVMWQHGSELFGHEWGATPKQVQRWQALVVQRARIAKSGWNDGDAAE